MKIHKNFKKGKEKFEKLIPEFKKRGIIPLEEYKGNIILIKFKCLKCGNIWKTQPASIKNGSGCPECAKKNINKKRVEEAKEKFKKLIPKLKEKGIIPIEEYKRNEIPIKFQCLKCGYIWDATPANIKNGTGCPKCAKENIGKKQFEEAKEKFNNLIPELEERGIIPLEEYKGNRIPIKFKCLKCGYIWKTLPISIKRGHGCPECAKAYTKKLFEEAKEKFNNLIPELEEKGIIPLEEYKGSKNFIKFQCLKCGHIWEAKPDKIKNGSGCPKCAYSKGEDILSRIFNKLNIKYIPQYSFDDLKIKGKLRFDFYLSNNNILIEFDGIQHFEKVKYFNDKKGLEKTQLSDKLKEEYCKQNNIPLIRISYKDFNKLENLLEVKNKGNINIINELNKLNYLN